MLSRFCLTLRATCTVTWKMFICAKSILSPSSSVDSESDKKTVLAVGTSSKFWRWWSLICNQGIGLHEEWFVRERSYIVSLWSNHLLNHFIECLLDGYFLQVHFSFKSRENSKVHFCVIASQICTIPLLSCPAFYRRPISHYCRSKLTVSCSKVSRHQGEN